MSSAQMPELVQKAIGNFQDYILSRYRIRAVRWPEAKPLIEAVADGITKDIDPTHGIDLRPIVECLDVKVTWSRVTEEIARASICPTPQGFHLELGRVTDSRKNRARFAMAHECGHCMFFWLESRPPRRLYPSTSQTLLWKEEGLCDAFAAALLVPTQIAWQITRENPDLVGILNHAERLRVSGEVLVRRLLQSGGNWPDMVFYRIDLVDSRLEARVFRGRNRKHRGDPAPSLPVIRRQLAGIQPADVPDKLLETVGSGEVVRTSKYSVWLRT